MMSKHALTSKTILSFFALFVGTTAAYLAGGVDRETAIFAGLAAALGVGHRLTSTGPVHLRRATKSRASAAAPPKP